MTPSSTTAAASTSAQCRDVPSSSNARAGGGGAPPRTPSGASPAGAAADTTHSSSSGMGRGASAGVARASASVSDGATVPLEGGGPVMTTGGTPQASNRACTVGEGAPPRAALVARRTAAARSVLTAIRANRPLSPLSIVLPPACAAVRAGPSHPQVGDSSCRVGLPVRQVRRMSPRTIPHADGGGARPKAGAARPPNTPAALDVGPQKSKRV